MSNSAPKPAGLNSTRLIQNANAPVLEVKIIIDLRYGMPPEKALVVTDIKGNIVLVPGSVVQGYLLDVAKDINMLWQQNEQVELQKPPDLPPAPSLEKPS